MIPTPTLKELFDELNREVAACLAEMKDMIFKTLFRRLW